MADAHGSPKQLAMYHGKYEVSHARRDGLQIFKQYCGMRTLCKTNSLYTMCTVLFLN